MPTPRHRLHCACCGSEASRRNFSTLLVQHPRAESHAAVEIFIVIAFAEAAPFLLRRHERGGSTILFSSADASNATSVILERLAALPEGGLLPVDLSDVRVCSEAARDLLRTPLLRITSGELPDRFVVLCGVDASRYNVDIMLRHEGLVVVERTVNGGAAVMGRLDPALQSTYEYLLARPTTTAPDVYRHFRLANPSAATNRLTTLARLGLARRVADEPVGRGARRHIYSPVR